MREPRRLSPDVTKVEAMNARVRLRREGNEGLVDAPRDEGFTLIEMVTAMTLMAIVFLAVAQAMGGGFKALAAARQRSAFVEAANAEIEKVRGLSYEDVGVNASDPNLASQYPSNQHNGRDAVIFSPDQANAPAAVSVVTTSPLRGIPLPYTVRRWITWTDTTGSSTHEFKRVDVDVEFLENQRSTRHIVLTSLVYPGSLGVTPGADPPTGSFTFSPNGATAPATVQFDGTGSSDPNSLALSYDWDFGDGSLHGIGTSPTHTYSAGGDFSVTLVVTNSQGTSSTPITRTVNVVSGAAGSAPTASFSMSPSSGVAPLTVNFDASASHSNPTGGSLTYDWNWGDGTTHGTTVNAGHVFQTAGTFSVVLTVKDTGNRSTSTSQSVSVTPLNCSVLTAQFTNPYPTNNGANATPNDIKVGSTKTTLNQPVSTSFTFTATANSACTSMTGHLSYIIGSGSNKGATGTLVVPLSYNSGTGTWSGTASVTNQDQFSTGSFQTSDVTGLSGTISSRKSITYSVHT